MQFRMRQLAEIYKIIEANLALSKPYAFALGASS